MDQYRASTFFRQVRNFTETLGVLFLGVQEKRGQDVILDRFVAPQHNKLRRYFSKCLNRLMAVSEDLYYSWTMNVLGKRNLRLPGRLYSFIAFLPTQVPLQTACYRSSRQ